LQKSKYPFEKNDLTLEEWLLLGEFSSELEIYMNKKLEEKIKEKH